MWRKLFLVVMLLTLIPLLTGGPIAQTAVAAPASPTAGAALNLNGSNQYVEIPHDPALNPTGAFTVEAWVYYGGSTACQTIISKDYTEAYWLGLCSGEIRFYGSGSSSSEDGNTALPGDVWTHVAVVYEGSGRKYYINGELDYQGGPEPSPTTSTDPVRIGSDTGGCCDFDGRISNVRLWNTARSQDQIRRWMHVAIDEPLPGLVANWRFSRNAEDNIGGHDGSYHNGAGQIAANPPAQPAFVPVDEFFNELSLNRYAAATAYVPDLDRVLLIGGQRSFSNIINDVDAINGSNGNQTHLADLPSNLTNAAAVYVPTTDKAYVFGGQITSSSAAVSDAIYAINPADGSNAALGATLPTAASRLAAVYHPGHDKVYLLGGRTGDGSTLDTVLVFDPATETVTPADFTLAATNYAGAAAYANGRLFLFGGVDGGSTADAIYEIAIGDDGLSGSVSLLAGTLPDTGDNLRAAVDPHTQLVYLQGAYQEQWLWVFDPVTGEAWRTQVGLPGWTDRAGVAYSPANRHLLIVGGDVSVGGSLTNVWRAPLGDGPLVPLGHWDFPQMVGDEVNAIDGDEDRVLIATDGSGAYAYRSTGTRTHYTPLTLGSWGVVNDVAYNPANDTVRIATDDAGAKLDTDGNGSIDTTYDSSVLGSNQVLSVDNYGFYGTHDAGVSWRRFVFFPPPGYYVWDSAFAGQRVVATAFSSSSGYWMIADNKLQHLDNPQLGGTETDYGQKCGLATFNDQMDLLVAPNDDWWLVSRGDGEFGGDGICRVPAAATPGLGSSITSLLGSEAMEIDVDADGRIWIAIDSDDFDSGGLAAFGNTDSGIYTSELNWLNAPLGSDELTLGGDLWDSSVSAVGAADERVWSGNRDGRLVTLAQRWQQLDDQNDTGSRIIQNVWTARGRAFLATSNSLHVLQPDGRTWDNPGGSVKVWDVVGDRQGRTWVATNTGIRLYDPTAAGGWDYLTDREGDRPSTAVYALAEDRDGRIWIGGLNGLTLFDRDRFVATFTTANSDLPADTIRTLFVDSDNRLWVGTDAGLAMLDGATWTTFTTADGLPNNAIVDLEQPGTGDIAISTATALSFYDGSTFSTQSLPIPDENLPLSVDERGRLWAGNAVLVGGRWEVYHTTDSGLASDAISDSATDGADRIWFSHAPDAGVSVRGTYLPPLDDVVPVIDAVLDQTGSAGDIVRVSGSGFGTRVAAVSASVGGSPADVVGVTPTEIELRLTEYNGSGDVSLQIGQRRTTATDAFCAIPVIDRVSPTGGNDGVVVNVYGSNFDTTATLYLDGTNPHTPHIRGADQLGTIIESADGTGNVRVVNDCPIGSISDSTVTATSSEEFRRIAVSLEQMVLNQGIQSTGLVADRMTMVQHYLSHSIPPRDTDRIELDTAEITVIEGGASQTIIYPLSDPADDRGTAALPAPTHNGPPGDALLRDVVNSVNAFVTPNLGGDLIPADNVEVQTVLKRRAATVASGSTTAWFRPNFTVRVLLVPIMPDGYTRADLNAMKNDVNGNLDDLRRRIFPTGQVDLVWSPTVYTPEDVLWDLFGDIGDSVDVGDTLHLYHASHSLDRARRQWNERHDPDVMIAYGVVEPSLNSGDAGGKAFWPDVSDLLNHAGLGALDALCDVGDAVLTVVTFGLAGGDGCDLEIPLYVGWGEGDRGSSQLIGHEMGHIFGLVKPWAANGDTFDNFSHSVYDELDGGECGSDGATYTVGKTLYRSPGVGEPVVNPLTGQQFRAQLTVQDDGDPAGAGTMRGKALMSYACSDGNRNVFFEPADVPGIFFEFGVAGAHSFFDDLTPGTARAEALATAAPSDTPTPIFVAGQRLYVTGLLNQAADTGSLRLVEVLGDEAPLDVSYETGYWLVQKDSSGAELGRTGIYPVFATSEEESDDGFFASTILAESGVAQIDLVHETTVLDSFSAGSAAPTVSVSSPSGGSYSSGTAPVTWSASDSDGDDLSITILYSADNGSTWTPVGFSQDDSGTREIPVATLAGSSNAKMKVVASDGFNTGEGESATFTVAAQPPLPTIGSPTDGDTMLEGRAVTLNGVASDTQDGFVDGANLAWRSDRDGNLGAGEELNVFLSVGTHTITLEATNSHGLSESDSVTVTVVGDYDYDGMTDDEESSDGLNLLESADAFSDDDGDGLPLIMERKRNLNPGESDTDGDGRTDGDEIADGTDPNTADEPLPPDELTAAPASLEIDANLALDTAMPQAQITLSSREPVDWTLTADVDWLAALEVEGTTSDAVTVMVNTEKLNSDGAHTGNLFFDSSLGRVTVPVTVTITNGEPPQMEVYLPFVIR